MDLTNPLSKLEKLEVFDPPLPFELGPEGASKPKECCEVYGDPPDPKTVATSGDDPVICICFA